MRLLFDQNLSPRLPRLLADLYPGSVHVREVGLRDADDNVIWDYAKAHGFAIVSKDSDFQQRSLLLGAPPKSIWLRLGNCSVAHSADFLRKHSPAIHTFEQDSAQSHLMLP
jgi:predicted nuclease of predicted toxin-antitoxin system